MPSSKEIVSFSDKHGSCPNLSRGKVDPSFADESLYRPTVARITTVR